MTDTLRPVEVELKYRVLDMPAAERYLVASSIGAFVGASQARSTQMEDRYVDTADHAFERAGFAVRLRASGTGVIVSVKSLARPRRPPAARSGARSWRVRRSGRRVRPTGPRPMRARSCSSSPAMPRSSRS